MTDIAPALAAAPAPAPTTTPTRCPPSALASPVASAQSHVIRPPFDNLVGQPLVARFLSSAIEAGQTSHAYLFVGPVGAGKNEAARELAKALVCKESGCGRCDDCGRIGRSTHPDVKVIEPEGVNGYIAEQAHDLIHDTFLAPIRAQHKVYILTRADLLSGAPANAFLKTLEEPPARVTFILLARTRESVLETLVSRCQTIAFRCVPEADAVPLLVAETMTTLKDARIAFATTGGSLYRARSFLGSSTRRDTRLKVLEAVERLVECDPLDVLDAVRELLIFLKQPLDEMKLEQEKQLVEGKEYLGRGALTALEQRQKRSLTSRERESLGEVLGAVRSWLRDCLLARVGRGEDIVNTDFHYNIAKVAAVASEAAFARAIAAVDVAEQQIHYNVSVQSVLEALLLTLRDELRGASLG